VATISPAPVFSSFRLAFDFFLLKSREQVILESSVIAGCSSGRDVSQALVRLFNCYRFWREAKLGQLLVQEFGQGEGGLRPGVGFSAVGVADFQGR